MQALRNNGFAQQSYTLTATDIPLSYYPNIPPASFLASGALSQQSITRIDPTVRAPYMMQASLAVERALPGRTSLSVNLIESRGVHSLISRDVNAPFPGTFGLASSPLGILPFPGYGIISQYETTGVYKQTQGIVNMSTRFNRRFSLNGYYALGSAKGDANGQLMDQYNAALDYGRTRFDIRHRGYIGGSITLPYNISAAPFITISSGGPFNITTGNQYNGDQIYNARPGIRSGRRNLHYSDSPDHYLLHTLRQFRRAASGWRDDYPRELRRRSGEFLGERSTEPHMGLRRKARGCCESCRRRRRSWRT